MQLLAKFDESRLSPICVCAISIECSLRDPGKGGRSAQVRCHTERGVIEAAFDAAIVAFFVIFVFVLVDRFALASRVAARVVPDVDRLAVRYAAIARFLRSERQLVDVVAQFS
jgi:hypothetical protein